MHTYNYTYNYAHVNRTSYTNINTPRIIILDQLVTVKHSLLTVMIPPTFNVKQLSTMFN